MKKANGMFIGFLFIVVGLLYAGSALNFFEFTIFFPGWWTLFIIIPCLYALTRKNEDKTGPVIGLVIGLCFLLNAQDFDFHINFFPMLLAVGCILAGWKLIFPKKGRNRKWVEENYSHGSDKKNSSAETDRGTGGSSYSGNSGYISASAVFGGKDIRVDNECFTGADITVLMGAVDLNLRNAIISEDVYINISAVMGGIDIFVPANVRVVTDGCATVMGGIDVNSSYANFHAADSPRVIITGSCVMGGVDIK